MKYFVLSLLLVGCAPENHCLQDNTCTDPSAGVPGANGEGSAASAAESTAPSCTVFGVAHIGLGGDDLAAQADGPPSGDRGRTKPYSALLTEYARVLGSENAPASIASTGPTFGVASDRWYLEPIPSAVVISTAFDVAFEGCLKLVNAPKYSAAPTPDSARAACTDWAKRFWSRDATPPQLDACAAVAVETTSETFGRPGVDEVTRGATPQRQWAYACASVLTATGFLTY